MPSSLLCCGITGIFRQGRSRAISRSIRLSHSIKNFAPGFHRRFQTVVSRPLALYTRYPLNMAGPVVQQSEDDLRLPDEPLLAGQELRLYSMRMCPYAQRARLILSAKKVNYDRVNIDLNQKPDWFFDLNPYGEVPVVIHKGGVVYESLIAAEYLEEAFSGSLLAEDPLTRAWERIYFNHWTKKGIPAFYSLLKAGYADPDQTNRLNEHMAAMNTFLEKLKKPYFHGDKVGYADYMIWPWFERLKVLNEISDYKLSKVKFPALTSWVERMWEDPTVQECKIDLDLMTKHYAHYRTGRPDFTLGMQPSKPVEEALENLDGLRDPSTRDRKKV